MSGLARRLMAGTTGADEKLYVDDVFSAYTYTGNGTAQTINNGIDLAGKGGLVVEKRRDDTGSWFLADTVTGIKNWLDTSTTAPQSANGFPSAVANSNGVTGLRNWSSPIAVVQYTFRKSPKFFDVVTYTGNGVAGRQIPHELGIAPGMVIVKCVSNANDWCIYHRSIGPTGNLRFNTSVAEYASTRWNNTEPTTTSFTVGLSDLVNQSGWQYVAYLFAHDPSADGIIQCGSFTADGSGNATVNLGWEPQFLLHKLPNSTSDWFVFDTQRGWSYASYFDLRPNLAHAENAVLQTSSSYFVPASTGFSVVGGAPNQTRIYLAIRRPNKPPTTGTQVYNAIARTGTGAAATVTGVGFAPDLVCPTPRTADNKRWFDRLRGNKSSLEPASTDVEDTSWSEFGFTMDGFKVGTNGALNGAGVLIVDWVFRRAPGFFDVVCYTGTGVAKTEAHGLGVVPELMIVKGRQYPQPWDVYHSVVGAGAFLRLASTGATITSPTRFDTTPTQSVFHIGTSPEVNGNTDTYVAYLFATKAGVSKVGNYTGNGTTQTINCGFTTGARFILVKRTDSTGDWYVWDSVRGIISANDPHLSLNTSAAEVTTDDSIDPDTSGFILNQVAATNINVNAASYIYLAIA